MCFVEGLIGFVAVDGCNVMGIGAIVIVMVNWIVLGDVVVGDVFV